MNYREYQTSRRALIRQIDETQTALRELNKKWILASPFKVGDKVTDGDSVFYVMAVEIGWTEDRPFRYTLTAPNKAGGMPQRVIRPKYYPDLNKLTKVETDQDG